MNKKSKPIRLEDLANLLNVSKVTVSKALRDHPDISPVTTARVKQLAEELGYMPNFMAKNLSSLRSNLIGLVVPEIAHFFFGAMIESIFAAASKYKYETVLTVSEELAEREKKHVQFLMSMKIDGLIISITQETTNFVVFQKIMENNIPIVFVDRAPEMPGISSVTVNDKGGAFAATEYAVNKGYKKIAKIGGNNNINIGRKRNEGFFEAMRLNGFKLNPDWVIDGGFGHEAGYNGFKSIYKKGRLPEYILAMTYPVALGIYEAAYELGVRIPQDIEITCFGNNTFKHIIPTVFNFVDQPTQKLGEEAVKLILKMINHPKSYEPEKIVLETKLLINHTNISD